MSSIGDGVWIDDIGGIDLDQGVVVRKRSGEVTREPLDPETAARFRQVLRAAHAQGDRSVRMDQFVLGEWRFVIRLGGEQVVQSFRGETGRVDPALQPIFDLVCCR